MASFSSSSTHHNWLLSLKVVLISTGVLFLAMVLRFSVPIVSDFIVSEVPSIWSFLLTWLRPPYLYILMNCIIISIVASSKLQHHHELDDDHSHSSNPLVIPPSPILDPESVNISRGIPLDYVVLPPVQIPPPEPIKISGDVRTDNAVLNVAVSNGYVYDAKVSQTSNDKIANEESVNAPSSVGTNLLRKDSLGFSLPNGDEKSPVSARFGHRKAAKAMPQGGRAALGVSKPKRQDTLESTWKTITDGRAMPLTRHLKKSDTWDSHSRRNGPLTDQNGNATASPPMNPKVMKKSETFSEGSRICKENSSPSSGKLRKEPSLSQDELNRRVEAFIKKFNEEMRLQRQESLRQYKEMINRGVH